MASVRDSLMRLLSVPGVRVAVLVGREGLPIEAAGRADPHLVEALGALGASALGTTEALGHDVAGGATVAALLEYETCLVSVHPVGGYAALVTLAENATSLTGIRRTLSTIQGELLQVLDAH